ncbi:hypothetical protein OAO01_03370 [Oligoflexia bacterium]|nr:hypothetical protein [Oligoflexia bacterium]
MKRTCKVSGIEFEITDKDLQFYQMLGVAPPTLCPDERCRRRLSWQNMSQLYRRKCDATGKHVISNISEEKPFPVYDQPYWWSDEWDFRKYGRDFDFTRTFYENFSDLLQVVPHPNLATSYLLDENSEYTNYAGGNKNCYLIFHADMNRDCLYGVGIKKCVDVLDALHTHGSELLYECVDCRNSYGLKFCEDCENCSDGWFLKNCLGCRNCFGCTNLRQKEGYLFNKQVTTEEYRAFIDSFQSGQYATVSSMRVKFREFVQAQAQRGFQGYQNDDVSGDQIFRSKDTFESFDVQESRDMKFCHRVYNGPNSDCYDMNEYGMQIQKVYEGLAIGINAYNVACCIFVNEQVSDVAYSMHVHHAQDIFGCISVPRGQYCILNKQYSKVEYLALRAKIVEHMRDTEELGEFFPVELSPFGYNETVASEYFPLDKKDVEARGWKWKDEQALSSKKQSYSIPDDIADVGDDILEQVLCCTNTGKNYKIQKAELDFYRKMKLPIPRHCYHERHRERFHYRNPRRLFARNCDQCRAPIQTSFASDRVETVLCEGCYEQMFQ